MVISMEYPLDHMSLTEIDCWTQTAASLNTLNVSLSANASLPDTLGKVNRLISAWPPDEALPAEGIEGVERVRKRLVAGLTDIKTSSERDIKYVITPVLTLCHIFS